MNVLILGGDGYLGWPTALHLSAQGHEVAVADNYLHRRLTREEDVEALCEVPNLHERTRLWRALGGREIRPFIGDLAEWEFMSHVFRECVPDVVVHYAEQPSAPYSMKDRHSALLTLHNNLSVTANLIHAVHRYNSGAHIVKLGTMGEYGTPDIDIEEGWIDIEHKGRRDRFLFPRQAASLYHTTKIMDTDLLWFYVRTWQLRVTDLMQGPVYGVFTPESAPDERVLTAFHYDELFGTVLNRFIVQAVAGHPLTIYGSGGQTRGYINLVDTLNCIRLCIDTPPQAGELRIFNQFTETFSVRQLAEKVQRAGASVGLRVSVGGLPNPRREKEEHYYNPMHTGLPSLGLTPHPLTDEVLGEMLRFVMRHKGRIRADTIFRGVAWER